MSDTILKAFLITSLAGSALTALIMLLKPLTRRIFGFRWHYYIWLAVLFVMLVPVRFTLPQSDMDIHAANIQTQQTAQTVQVNNEGVAALNASEPALENTITDIMNSKKTYPAVIWLSGIIFFLLVSVIGYVRLIMRLRKNSVISDCPELRKYTDRKITVRIWKEQSSPFMLGVLRPTLVLPDRELDAEQLDNILRHEITHFKRGDILYKQLAVIVRCIHWFNPVVYYVAKQINTECEISCDLSVTSRMTDSERRSYINTILELASGKGLKSIPLTTQMASGKRVLKRRFTMIKNMKKTSKLTSVISAVSAATMLAAAVSAGGLLCGCVIREKDSGADSSVQEQSEQTDNLEQLYAEVYDVQEGTYVCRTEDFCMVLPDNIKMEEYDLNGSAPDSIEKLWNVNMLPSGEISIKIQNKIIDIPESKEILMQRLADRPSVKGENSPYKTGEYTVTDFMRVLYPDFPPDYSIVGYHYTVSCRDGGFIYVQEIPVSDTKTLRAVADIKTLDENVRRSMVDIVQSIKTKEIIEAAHYNINK